jgi:poly-gamma-glutamate capsule biosynthesis protein CapA/YwtB (metallophosphatase superfamily)
MNRAIYGCALILVLCGFAPLSAAERADEPVSVIFVGDVMLGGGPGHVITNHGDPFADFSKLLASADIAVCNLECSVSQRGTHELKKYTFRAPVKCIPLLKQHFTAVGLANNHACDYGKDGLVDELNHLEQADLPYFGAGRNVQQAERPLLLTRHGVRVALLAFNAYQQEASAARSNQPGVACLVPDRVAAAIKAARQHDHADLVLLYLHWGEEEEESPTPQQQTLARKLIDAGADAVIGAHPHVTQSVDYYHGRPIVYSLGNMVFDYHPNDPPQWFGWIAKLTFSKPFRVDLETTVLQIDAAGIPHPFDADAPLIPKK